MKIMHICLAAAYVEGYGYQENILTQLHYEMGHQIVVLTSDKIFNTKYERIERTETEYINDYGIHVKTLKKNKRNWLCRYGMYEGVLDELETAQPDIIFVHGGQFYSLKDIVLYCVKHRNVKLYIDHHADYYNTPVNTFKRLMSHRYIYGHWMRRAIPYTEKYWGVTPWRCQYLHEVYRIPEKKIGLLVMGGDDRHIHFDQMPQLRRDIRKQLNLDENDFVVITGGKIDSTKNIHLLMDAIIELNRDDLKLIVFGQPNNEMAPIIEKLSKDKHIRSIGWLDSTKVYDYFLSSDLVVFPGTHSVLWEQACACKIPCLVKRWEGMAHVNNGGNCEFLDDVSVAGLKKSIQELIFTGKFDRMKEIAQSEATDIFLYSKIAEKSIG